MACRDGNIYTIKNGQVLSNVIELETQPVGLVRFDAGIEGPKGFRRPWVAFMAGDLGCCLEDIYL